MHEILTIAPRLWPMIRSMKADIVSNMGTVYLCHVSRNLEFSVYLDDALLVQGTRTKSSGRTKITLIKNKIVLGSIRPRLTPFCDIITVGDASYKLPGFFRPNIPQLGLRFSRFGLTGLSAKRVEVNQDSNLVIALALLAYLFARGVFVEGD